MAQTNEVSRILKESALVMQGHRWSAAFPSLMQPLSESLDAQNYHILAQDLCYIEPDLQMVACGDYLPAEKKLHGRVEGAVNSGIQAANALIRAIGMQAI